MQTIIDPKDIEVIEPHKIKLSNLEIADDWGSKEYEPFLIKLFQTLPPFIRNNFKIRIRVTKDEGGAQTLLEENVIELRVPIVFIGKAMQRVFLQSAPEYKILGKLDLPTKDLLDRNELWDSNKIARGNFLADNTSSNSNMVRALNVFAEMPEISHYASIILHEYSHLIFARLREQSGIYFSEQEDYINELNKDPNFAKEYEEQISNNDPRQYKLTNQDIFALANKTAYLYAKYLSPKDFFEFLNKRYFIILEEIMIRINEAMARSYQMDTDITAGEAISGLSEEIFDKTLYQSFLVPKSEEFYEMLRKKGCRKSLEEIATKNYTMKSFIEKSLERFPDLPQSQRDYFEEELRKVA